MDTGDYCDFSVSQRPVPLTLLFEQCEDNSQVQHLKDGDDRRFTIDANHSGYPYISFWQYAWEFAEVDKRSLEIRYYPLLDVDGQSDKRFDYDGKIWDVTSEQGTTIFKWKDKDNPVAKLTGERLEILLDQREGYESCIILASLFYLEMLRFPESYEEHPITLWREIVTGEVSPESFEELPLIERTKTLIQINVGQRKMESPDPISSEPSSVNSCLIM